jgi:hypothetical protein
MRAAGEGDAASSFQLVAAVGNQAPPAPPGAADVALWRAAPVAFVSDSGGCEAMLRRLRGCPLLGFAMQLQYTAADSGELRPALLQIAAPPRPRAAGAGGGGAQAVVYVIDALQAAAAAALAPGGGLKALLEDNRVIKAMRGSIQVGGPAPAWFVGHIGRS